MVQSVKVIALIAAPMIIAASSGERPLKASEAAAIKHSIEAQLVDPSSAQFRMEPIRPASEYYCGLVNARNRMGGYNGFEPFMVRFNPDRTIKIVLLPGSEAADLKDALSQAIQQKCAENGYRTAY